MGDLAVRNDWRCDATPPSQRSGIEKRYFDFMKRCAYTQDLSKANNIFEKIGMAYGNTIALQKTTGLSGLDKKMAELHNALVVGINPIAAAEYIQKLGKV